MIGLCMHACFVLICILEKARGEGLGFCLKSSFEHQPRVSESYLSAFESHYPHWPKDFSFHLLSYMTASGGLV